MAKVHQLVRSKNDQASRSREETRPPSGGAAREEQERDRPDAQVDSDAELRARLHAALADGDDFDAAGIELLVTQGIVVMLGKVPNYQTKRRLEAACVAVRGVREVHDQLQVEAETLADSLGDQRRQLPRSNGKRPRS